MDLYGKVGPQAILPKLKKIPVNQQLPLLLFHIRWLLASWSTISKYNTSCLWEKMMKNTRERDKLKDDCWIPDEYLWTRTPALALSELTALSLPDAPLSTHLTLSERCRCFSQNTAGDSHVTQGMGFPTQGLSSSQKQDLHHKAAAPGDTNASTSRIFLRMGHIVPHQKIFPPAIGKCGF